MAGTSREAGFALPGHDDAKLQRAPMPSLRVLAKQSIFAPARKLDCFVVSLLAMTELITRSNPASVMAGRRPGHPRPCWATQRTWMPGTRPGMTPENVWSQDSPRKDKNTPLHSRDGSTPE